MRMNNPYFHDDVFYNHAGSSDIPDYQLSYDDNGISYLKEVGRIPLYEKIQASRSLCDLETVLKSCVHTNQVNVPSLDFVQGAFTDFSRLHSMADLFVASKNVSSIWNELPLEVREQFDSNLHLFTKSLGSDEFDQKLIAGYDKFNSAMSHSLQVDNSVVVPQPDKPIVDVVVPNSGGDVVES